MPIHTLLQMQRSLQYGNAEALSALAQARAELKERGKLTNEITQDGHAILVATLMAAQLAEACNQKGLKIPIDLYLNGSVRYIGYQRAQRLFHNPDTLSTTEQRVLSVYRIGLNYLYTLTSQVSHLRQDENRDARGLYNYAQTIFKSVFSQALNQDAKKYFQKTTFHLNRYSDLTFNDFR